MTRVIQRLRGCGRGWLGIFEWLLGRTQVGFATGRVIPHGGRETVRSMVRHDTTAPLSPSDSRRVWRQVPLVWLGFLTSGATDPPVRFTETNAAYHNYWVRFRPPNGDMPITTKLLPGPITELRAATTAPTVCVLTLYR